MTPEIRHYLPRAYVNMEIQFRMVGKFLFEKCLQLCGCQVFPWGVLAAHEDRIGWRRGRKDRGQGAFDAGHLYVASCPP